MELWELIARESIRDLVARYNASGDSGRFDQVLDLFANDAEMCLDRDTGREVFQGHAEILTIFTGTKARWADDAAGAGGAETRPGYVRHRIATHQIDFVDRRHGVGYCYYQVVMHHGLDHWGRYFDEYREQDGRWLFTKRRVTREGQVDG